jgi:hypothetical protein
LRATSLTEFKRASSLADAIYDVIVTGLNFGQLGQGELLNDT